MTPTQRAVLGALVAAIVGFAIGAGWQYTRASAFRAALETTRATLDSVSVDRTFQRLEATLSAAAVEAQRGNYESARRLASDFFTGLQAEVGSAPPAAQPALNELLSERDAMITALSRASAESTGLLGDMVARYRTAFGEPVGPVPAPASPE